MADSGLFALYKLHLVDRELFAIKQRAANLDVGQSDRKDLQDAQAEFDRVDATAAALEKELADLEAENKRLGDRAKKLHKDLYGGGFVGARDAETIEQEMASIKEQTAAHDERILALYEEAPAAREVADRAAEALKAVKVRIVKKQTAAKAEHEKLQAAYKAKAAERGPLLPKVPRPVLDPYEKLREKMGTGMALVTDEHRCEACGMHVPEKAFEFIVADRVTPCENCRRVLFRLQQS